MTLPSLGMFKVKDWNVKYVNGLSKQENKMA
jgi:hypothetical protein